MLALALLGLAVTACDSRPSAVAYDLAARLPVADRQSSRETVLFGTPAARTYEAEGFFRWSGGPGDRFVWARKEVEVALRFEEVAPRAAILDLRPFEGVKDQAATVLLNGREVARLGLASARQRYLIPLPSAAQQAGENRLRFEFAGSASAAEVDPRSHDGGQLAAAFFSLVLASVSDSGLVDLLGRDAPRPFAQVEDAGVPGFVQPAGTRVRYAVKLPARAELRFAPQLPAAARSAGGRARLRVSVESIAGRERELWSRTLAAADAPSGEVALALPGVEGERMRLLFSVDAAGSERGAWALWRAPRVVGRAGESLRAVAATGRRAAQLRDALRAKSVVFVILDAARARQLGCYGYGRATTPELDRIAREGIVFERAYTPAVYTVGAMSSVWTSQQPDQHHGETSFEARLPSDRLTLAELLSARGIRTAGFVANAMAGRALGFERGFGEFHEVFGDLQLGSRAELFRRSLPAWLAANKASRFFLYVHFREPHFPYDPPAPFRARFGEDAPLPTEASRDRAWYVEVNRGDRKASAAEIAHLVRLYDGNLAYVDRELGALRSLLEEQGLLEDVVLVIAADHGEQLYEHGYISHSAQVYEESSHVPLILRLPREAGLAGRRVPELVDLTDLAPTIADVFGALGQGGSEREFEGRSLLPVSVGGPGKAVVVARSVWERPLYAIRDGRYKLIRDTRSGSDQLFDLGADPGERRDVSAVQPIPAESLSQELDAWLGRVRQQRAGGGEKAQLTPEQCENMRSLGYVDGCR